MRPCPSYNGISFCCRPGVFILLSVLSDLLTSCLSLSFCSLLLSISFAISYYVFCPPPFLYLSFFCLHYHVLFHPIPSFHFFFSYSIPLIITFSFLFPVSFPFIPLFNSFPLIQFPFSNCYPIILSFPIPFISFTLPLPFIFFSSYPFPTSIFFYFLLSNFCFNSYPIIFFSFLFLSFPILLPFTLPFLSFYPFLLYPFLLSNSFPLISFLFI